MTDHTKMTEAELLLAAAKLADEQSKRVVAPGWEDYVAMRYRLTALADRLRDGCVVPRKDYGAILKQAMHYFTPKADSDRFCAICGEYLTSPMHIRAMLKEASDADKAG